MGRCRISITPYRSMADCQAAEGEQTTSAPGPWREPGPFLLEETSATPDTATPWGNEAARQSGRVGLAQMSTGTISEMIAAISRVLAPSGYLFLWLDKFHLCEGVSAFLDGADLARVDMVTWDKTRIGMGHRTRRRSEYLLVLQKPPLKARATWTRRNIPDVWAESVPRKGHPHAKPPGLLTALLEAVTSPGDLVVDPAAGGFATLAATAALDGRRFLGSDLVDHTGSGAVLPKPPRAQDRHPEPT